MRDVEDAGSLADGLMLGDDALVLERHLPAGEGSEARAERLVAIGQREATKPAAGGIGPAVLGHLGTLARWLVGSERGSRHSMDGVSTPR